MACNCITAPCDCDARYQPMSVEPTTPALEGAANVMTVEFPWLESARTGPIAAASPAPAAGDFLELAREHQTAIMAGTAILFVLLLLKGRRR